MKHNSTLKIIADNLGISISTVSRALHGNPRIGIKTRERVLSMAKSVNYSPNQQAINLLHKRTFTLGIIVPTLAEEFFAHIIAGAEQIARDHGFQLIIGQSQNDTETERAIVDSLIKSRVDGVMVTVASKTSEYNHLIKLQQTGIEVVFFDRIPRNLPGNKVISEIKQGTRIAMEFLHKRNISRIALLNGPNYFQVSDERLNAYLETIQDLKLKTSPSYIKSTDLSEETTKQKMEELLRMGDMKPEAVLCFNDYVSLYAIKSCIENSVVPNVDVQFVSLTYSNLTKHTNPRPVASIKMFPKTMGKEAASMLITSIENNQQLNYNEVSIKTELTTYD
jgi:DNA-binding LacI/PurR family transcriptional regulator